LSSKEKDLLGLYEKRRGYRDIEESSTRGEKKSPTYPKKIALKEGDRLKEETT